AWLVPGGEGPLLSLGTESLALASLVPVDLDVLHCPSLGLMGQDRTQGLRLPSALAEAGVRERSRVALVGWKYFEPDESLSFAVAAYVVDALRALDVELFDATETLMNPRDGLRTTSSADQIAAFEWAAARASAAVATILRAAEPGLTEREVVAAIAYGGEPLSAHVMLA